MARGDEGEQGGGGGAPAAPLQIALIAPPPSKEEAAALLDDPFGFGAAFDAPPHADGAAADPFGALLPPAGSASQAEAQVLITKIVNAQRTINEKQLGSLKTASGMARGTMIHA